MRCKDCKELTREMYCLYHKAYISPEIINKDIPCPAEEADNGS